jgi:hypothetical protein
MIMPEGAEFYWISADVLVPWRGELQQNNLTIPITSPWLPSSSVITVPVFYCFHRYSHLTLLYSTNEVVYHYSNDNESRVCANYEKFTLSIWAIFFSAAHITFEVNPHLTLRIRSSKAARSVKPRWTSLMLYGINGDTGKRPWKVK